MSKIEPIFFDILTIRKKRQDENNILALECIKNNNFTKNCNIKEYKRILEDYKYNNKTEKDLLEDCKNNYSAMILLAKLISINASRQCINDEIIQISSCEKTFNKCGIYI